MVPWIFSRVHVGVCLITASTTIVCAGLAAPAADASLVAGTIAYEGFDYATTLSADLVDGLDGGEGWSGPWDWTYSAGSSLQVTSPGMSYTGLATTGNQASFYLRPGGNQIAQATRSFAGVSSGVVYLRIMTSGISNSNGSSGLGTPRIALKYQGTQTAALGGNGVGSPTYMALMDAGLTTQLIVEPELLSSTSLLTILRIDFDAGETSLWSNPDMSTFDYSDPPTPIGTVAQSFAFDTFDILLRQGSVDEISVLQMALPPEDPQQRPPDWVREYGRLQGEDCPAGATPSWSEWPNDRHGGYVCREVLTWSHEKQTFVLQ